MALARCPNGHYYDPGLYTTCPHCGTPDLDIVRAFPRRTTSSYLNRRLSGDQESADEPARDVRDASTRQPERFRAFISSTFIDLQEYRQAVFNSIMALGNSAEDMVYWSADERGATAASRSRVQESDVLILLLAHRYGSVPEGSAESIVEEEYTTARSASIPVLAFLIDESVPWPPHHIQWDRHAQLSAFKTKVKEEVVVKTFTSPDHLAALVSQALAAFNGLCAGIRQPTRKASFLREVAVG